jgi:hypothetical protein
LETQAVFSPASVPSSGPRTACKMLSGGIWVT